MHFDKWMLVKKIDPLTQIFDEICMRSKTFLPGKQKLQNNIRYSSNALVSPSPWRLSGDFKPVIIGSGLQFKYSLERERDLDHPWSVFRRSRADKSPPVKLICTIPEWKNSGEIVQHRRPLRVWNIILLLTAASYECDAGRKNNGPYQNLSTALISFREVPFDEWLMAIPTRSLKR